MTHTTTAYILRKDEEQLEFSSEKDACEFLGVKQCSVASCCRRKRKCHGYTIERVGPTTHQSTNTRLFKIWGSMHERCERVNHTHYKDYGGRGISVCDEWSEYVPFMKWSLVNGYQDNLTLDRKDTDGNYCPENCQWVTMKQQQNNKRNNRRLLWNGETHTVSEWSEITGIKPTTIIARLNAGWSTEESLTTPVRVRTQGYRPSDVKERMDGGSQ